MHADGRVRDGEEVIQYLKGDNGFRNRQEHPLPSLLLLDLKIILKTLPVMLRGDAY